ncbi:hypothetical protein AQUSIP_06680 [Aquicella siphonis]|uniref:Uncharacterized protein n=1 Tax=Aquicella siphonis TaxID=254247 RepID=A0A5E4PFU6_9COXI|nr:hypothetical protein AQUSIP_06680 [Aquicella siphonis]
MHYVFIIIFYHLIQLCLDFILAAQADFNLKTRTFLICMNNKSTILP